MFPRTSYVLMGVLVVVFGLTTLASANVIARGTSARIRECRHITGPSPDTVDTSRGGTYKPIWAITLAA